MTGDTRSEAEQESARFDESLAELERLVEHLERGEMDLEESLNQFERGVGLARRCRDSLAKAEQKVQILRSQDGEDELGPFGDPDGGSPEEP